MTTFVMTGWRWIDSFDDFDPERIIQFTKDRYNKAPEPGAK